MAGVNEYFQLVEQEQKAYLRIIPSVEDGEVLDVKEVMAYLTDIGYENFNMKELNDAVVQNAEEKQVYVGPWKGFHEQEKVKLKKNGVNITDLDDKQVIKVILQARDEQKSIAELAEEYK